MRWTRPLSTGYHQPPTPTGVLDADAAPATCRPHNFSWQAGMATQRYTTWFRPRTVTAAAALLYIYGVVFLLFAAATLPAAVLPGVVVAACAVFLTLLGSQVIRGEVWARTVGLIVVAVCLSWVSFVGWMSGFTIVRVFSIVGALGLVALVILLLTPSSRAYFRPPAGQDPTS